MVTDHGANSPTDSGPEVPEQAGKLLAQFAGYIGFKTIEMGLTNGLLAALNSHPIGLTADELTSTANTEAFYTGVWAKGRVRSRVA